MTSRTFLNIFAFASFSWAAITFWAIAALVSAPQPILAAPNHLNHAKNNPSVSVDHAWARATPTGAKVAAAYFTMNSSGSDVLLSASSAIAGRTEIHQTTQDVNGALQMRGLPAGIDLSAGKPIALAPGGTHIMLMDLKTPLHEGFELPLTLTFKHAGVRHVRVAIKPVSYMPGMGADSMPHEGAHHGHHH